MTINLSAVTTELQAAMDSKCSKPSQIVRKLADPIQKAVNDGNSPRSIAKELVVVLEKQGVTASFHGIYSKIRKMIASTDNKNRHDKVAPQSIVPEEPVAPPVDTDPDSLAAITKPAINQSGKLLITAPPPREPVATPRKVLSGTRRFVEPQVQTTNSQNAIQDKE